LTPITNGASNTSKWRGRVSPGGDAVTPATYKPKAASKTEGKPAPTQQWRTVGQTKENAPNVAPKNTFHPPLRSVDSTAKPAVVSRSPAGPSGPSAKKAEKISSTAPLVTIESPSPEQLVPRSPATPGTGTKNTSSPSVSSPKTPGSSPKIVDIHQLDQRQKQIDYGHQTLGYIRYRLLVPKEKRSRDDPRTPKKTQACSKRSWDGQIKKWRRDLHKWDPEDSTAFMAWLESDFVLQIIQNNIGTELLDLLAKIKERAAKFENSPAARTPCTPSPSTLSPVSRVPLAPDSIMEDEDDEKIARKLVF